VSHVLRFTTFAVALAASSAAAAPDRMSDAQFIAANRCLGLMQSKALATPDALTLASLLKAEGGSRLGIVLEQADEARDDAERLASRAGDEARARLVRERDGPCQAYLPAASVATTPTRGATP